MRNFGLLVEEFLHVDDSKTSQNGKFLLSCHQLRHFSIAFHVEWRSTDKVIVRLQGFESSSYEVCSFVIGVDK